MVDYTEKLNLLMSEEEKVNDSPNARDHHLTSQKKAVRRLSFSLSRLTHAQLDYLVSYYMNFKWLVSTLQEWKLKTSATLSHSTLTPT